MKRRWKILIAAGVFLVLLAASLTLTLHVQPENELEAYKKSLRDQGEKLELSEALPPPAAPEDNNADVVNDAFRMLDSGFQNVPDMMQTVSPGKAMVGQEQADARGSRWFTNSWEEFAASVESNRPAIELLHQVLTRPKLDFQLDYKKGVAILMVHLPQMKRSVQVLDATTILDLHNRDIGAAVTNILTLLTLVHEDAREGPLISYLVRQAMIAIAIAPTWELLQAPNLTDAQLAAIQDAWLQLDLLGDAENAFAFERAWTIGEIEKSRATHEGFQEIFGAAAAYASGGSDWSDVFENLTTSPRYVIAEAMWRSSSSYSEELNELKTDQAILPALRMMRTNRSQFYKADFDVMVSRMPSIGTTNIGQAVFQALRIPNFEDYFVDPGSTATVRKTLQSETARRIVVTAIALKRFQLKYGHWPATLDQLVPEFTPAVPIDPYDGKHLKYHPNADGTFLLYSAAENGVDDGGDPGSSPNWQHRNAPDWVWPQPATPAEVQNFYEHPPK